MSRARLILAGLMAILFTGLVAVPASAAPVTNLPLPELVKKVKAQAPDLQFFGAEAVIPYPISDPYYIEEWKLNVVSFELGIESALVVKRDGTIIGVGPWSLPFGTMVVDEVYLTEEEAYDLVKQAGFTGPFSELYLDQVLVPQSEPAYHFCMVLSGPDALVSVGAHSGNVALAGNC